MVEVQFSWVLFLFRFAFGFLVRGPKWRGFVLRYDIACTHIHLRKHSQKYIHKTVPQGGTQVLIFIYTRGVGGRRPPPPWLIELGASGL